MKGKMITVDGNEAVASVAYRLSEAATIYPITPSSPMGEHADEWSAQGRQNIWGGVPRVVEMQSEGGAAGAMHGSLQAGALTTTFTASQGLLLMIPNMFKIAGELTSCAMHVSARTVATHALSIFGDHSDVMAARSTGWALLASGSVQEAHHLACIAHAATLKARVPVLHFFDGFRTSHEVSKIEYLEDETLRDMIDDDLVAAHRKRALSPDRPFIRGTAQNPDVFFQAREACNPYYMAAPDIFQEAMDKFSSLTGYSYHLFDYVGHPEAERVLVIMGSGAETAHETVQYLTEQGEKVGVIKVRLFRPFSARHFVNSLPKSVKTVAVLDRTKESGSLGEPLYLDVVSAIEEMAASGELPTKDKPRIIGGRYGLSSKEFTPAMVKAVLDEASKPSPKNHFTVGIDDDVAKTSLELDRSFSIPHPGLSQAVFFGLGADGTVGANKNSIKIIGEGTDLYAQGYFVYDSKKSGGITISHLRFGPEPIRSTYVIQKADFVGCHQFPFVEKYDVLNAAAQGATFLLNSPYGPEEVWDHLPVTMQRHIIDKKLKFYVIDAYRVAREKGLGVRINTIMQTCFFALSGILPKDDAIGRIKEAIEKTYGKRGEAVVEMNIAAVDAALDHMHQVNVPERVTASFDLRPPVSPEAPEFVRDVLGPMIALKGDELPVSALPADGTFPSGTSRWEKRNIALEIPQWEPEICIQCGKCALVCPHATIRGKVYEKKWLEGAPEGWRYAPAKWPKMQDMYFTIQVAPEDCVGCGLCVQNCPAKSKADAKKKAINMTPQLPIKDREVRYWEHFLSIPDIERGQLNIKSVKDVMLLRPLFEFSGACAGCGETPYVKLLSQLFGDRAIVANATGCSSIYGGNLPTTPWTYNDDGRGPAWSNSLFEDNAEFGLGMRLSANIRQARARQLLSELAGSIGERLVDEILKADQSDESGLAAVRQRVAELKTKLSGLNDPKAKELAELADDLVKRSIWIVGGDGWAYDIGYGGLDHVLASGENVNVLVLDTEVYSNTGGQMSKATPMGAVAKFAAAGKPAGKKDLALMAMAYGNVYVARVAIGANDAQTIRAFLEAESYPGSSIIIAYCHCIAHGYDLKHGLEQQKKAVACGHWPLLRYDPRLAAEGKSPLQLDSKAPQIPLKEYALNETRFAMLHNAFPERAEKLLEAAQKGIYERWALYEGLSQILGRKEDAV